MEKLKNVDQIPPDSHEADSWWCSVKKLLWEKQGSLVASYRTTGGVKRGPYYAYRYRDKGRQRSHYLGSSREVVDLVQTELTKKSAADNQRRYLDGLKTQARKQVKESKKQMEEELAKIGLTMKGWEVHGWRKLRE
ncbi:hypothetical protein [Bythopirellula goksoeyrii]|uniref:Uncharacterized protein n=1 Tax=Bythopirellula goksoeyrii TaxID=1400387 RepID=A0A5B9QAW0_9BACT|nr:hypothetical protein [Bythopirellula goksoeyrii]QEG36058.1 hypothetical protein Pr1d_33670 [Bythopirellula goksoeyrii]